MKKIFTVLFFLGIITTGFAQSNRYPDNRNSRDVVLGQDRNVYNDNGRYDQNRYDQRERMIQQINREFEFKMMQLQRNRYLRSGEKRRQIRMLEMQRDQQIREVNARFSNTWNNNRRDDDWNRNKRY